MKNCGLEDMSTDALLSAESNNYAAVDISHLWIKRSMAKVSFISWTEILME